MEKNHRNKIFLSLTKKALIAAILLMFPVMITFIWSYNAQRSTLKNEILTNLRVVANSYEKHLYQLLTMLRYRAQDFASDGYIRTKMQEILRGNKAAVAKLNDHLIRNKIVLGKALRRINILTLSGKIVASTDSSKIGKMLRYQLPSKKILDSFTSNISIDEQDTPPTIAIITPLKNIDTNKQIGLLANYYSLSRLSDIFNGKVNLDIGAITRNKDKQKMLDIYVVSNDKRMLTESVFIKNAALKQIVNTRAVNACLESNIETSAFYKDYRGVEVAGASICLPSLKWVLLAEINKSKAMDPVRLILMRAIISWFIVIILIIISLLLILRYVTGPLRRMSDAALQIARGKFDINIPVVSTDEIGKLAQTFNNMAHQLKANIGSLIESRSLLTEAQKVAGLGNWNWDIASNSWRYSDELRRIFGFKPEEIDFTRKTILNTVHPDDLNAVSKSIETAMHELKPSQISYRIILPDRTERIVSEHIEIIRDATNKVIRVLGAIQDITEQKRLEFELAKLSSAIQQSVNIVMITDKHGNIEYVNHAFEDITGYDANDALGKTPAIISSNKTTDNTYKNLWDTIRDGKIWHGTIQNKKKSGELYWVNISISPIKDQQGNISHFLAIQEDITKQKEAKKQTEYLAKHDTLTGIINRTYFLKQLGKSLNALKRIQENGALLLIGIDQFKVVNDAYGHGFGDNLLKRFGEIINAICMNLQRNIFGSVKIIVARMGGDEFAVFLPTLDAKRATVVAEKIRKTIANIEMEKLDYHLSASIGISHYPTNGSDVKVLISKADLAMYRAKTLGRNKIHSFAAEDTELEKMHSRLMQKEKILEAIREERFEPWYQPILEIMSNEIHHYEVLARLRDKDGKIIPPDAFIGIAESFGIINLIDKMIIKKALQTLKKLNISRKKLNLELNLSGQDLGDKKFLSTIADLIKDIDIDPGDIIFEITETTAVQNIDIATSFIKQLKSLGCKFALDDFGVGFTSFVYLEKLPIDYIKIDGYFIKNIDQNPNDQLFVKAIVDVSKGMGIKTIAEFVETEKVLSFLNTYHVDYAQGYYIGKPVPKIDA